MERPDHLLELIGRNGKFSGHVRKHPTNGHLYVVINDYKRDETGQFLTDGLGKKIRDPQWISTGLKIRNNMRRAEDMIPKILEDYTQKFIAKYSERNETSAIGHDMPFADYLYYWLEIKKLSIRKTTYASYRGGLDDQIAPYFKELGLALGEVKAEHIQRFYTEQAARGIKNNSIIKYHASLHNAFRHAVKAKLLTVNPMNLVIRPKPETFIGSYYSNDEAKKVIEHGKGSKMELHVLFAAFYGLRRSEIIGLKWDCFNFDDDVFTIRHTVTQTFLDGHQIIIEEDLAKSESSIRSLPLVGPVKDRLLFLREQQSRYRKLCGRSYHQEYSDYVCVDQIGARIKPNYITSTFPKLLEKAGLRKVRFHDMRHPYVKPALKIFQEF